MFNDTQINVGQVFICDGMDKDNIERSGVIDSVGNKDGKTFVRVFSPVREGSSYRTYYPHRCQNVRIR